MEPWDRWHVLLDENPTFGDRVEIEYEGEPSRFPDSPHPGPHYKQVAAWEGVAALNLPSFTVKRWRHLDAATAERWKATQP